jgi:threonine/homoserine/homoserine lactone efflux protein
VGQAIGQILPLAVGVALSAAAIIAVVLMLVTPKAKVNGPAFVVRWVAGLTLLGVIVIGILDPAGANDEGQQADWVSWLKLALGALLLLVALRQWRGRPHEDDDPAAPKWMGAIATFTPAKALGTGVVLSALNPKNLLLAVAAGAEVAQAGLSATDEAVVYGIFVLIATVGVAAPVVIFFVLGDRSGPLLERLKDWMSRNNAAIMAVLCLIIGAKLIGDAIGGLS